MITCSPFIRVFEGEGQTIIYSSDLDFWCFHHVPIILKTINNVVIIMNRIINNTFPSLILK